MNSFKRQKGALALVLMLALAVFAFAGCQGKSGGGGGGGEPEVSNPPGMGTLSVTINWPAPPTACAGCLIMPDTTRIRARVRNAVTSENVALVEVPKPTSCSANPPNDPGDCTTTASLSVPVGPTYNVDAAALLEDTSGKPVIRTSGTAEVSGVSVDGVNPTPVTIHLNNRVIGGPGSNVPSTVNFTALSVNYAYGDTPNLGMTFTDWPADLVNAVTNVYYVNPTDMSIRQVGSPPNAGVCSLGATLTSQVGANLESTRATCAAAPPLSGGDFQVVTPTSGVAFLARIDGTTWLMPNSATTPVLTLLPTSDASTTAVTTFDVRSGTSAVGLPQMGSIGVTID